VYSLDLKNINSTERAICLVARETMEEAHLWHRRLEHVNFKNINKLVKGNLVRGLPSKTYKNDHSCLACKKGKQHKVSCKKIEERTIREPLELSHMDLFRPVSVESLNKKKYCLVITYDCSRFRPRLFFQNKLLLPLFTSFLCGRAEEHVCFFSDKRASFLFFPLPKFRHLLPLITSSFTSYLFIHKPYISFPISNFYVFVCFFRAFTSSSARRRPFVSWAIEVLLSCFFLFFSRLLFVLLKYLFFLFLFLFHKFFYVSIRLLLFWYVFHRSSMFSSVFYNFVFFFLCIRLIFYVKK
jgi:hypothetical protein